MKKRLRKKTKCIECDHLKQYSYGYFEPPELSCPFYYDGYCTCKCKAFTVSMKRRRLENKIEKLKKRDNYDF